MGERNWTCGRGTGSGASIKMRKLQATLSHYNAASALASRTWRTSSGLYDTDRWHAVQLRGVLDFIRIALMPVIKSAHMLLCSAVGLPLLASQLLHTPKSISSRDHHRSMFCRAVYNQQADEQCARLAYNFGTFGLSCLSNMYKKSCLL